MIDIAQSEHFNAPHFPVMLPEVMAALAPQKGEHFIDGTFGAGGYSRAILDKGARVTAFDRDPNAIAAASDMIAHYGGQLSLVEKPFSHMADHFADMLDGEKVDGVVLDIGVSSMQLDQAERGFSFRLDGPLDMRMEGAHSVNSMSAADLINTEDHGPLAFILKKLGDEKQAGRIATMILRKRAVKPFETTAELAAAIEGFIGRKASDRIHPATRTFQALRIFVNDELGELAKALVAAEKILKPGGRLVIVTFHSLEDRIVKRFMQERSSQPSGSRHLPQMDLRPLTFEAPLPKVMTPSENELEINPRSRSAKLRLAMRNQSAPLSDTIIEQLLDGLPRPKAAEER